MCRGLTLDNPARVKYTFKGRDQGRYVWSSDEGDVCCGVKYFWNPKGAPVTMRLTRLEKENALATSLWGAHLSKDVSSIAEEQLEELERLGYAIIKKRVSQ